MRLIHRHLAKHKTLQSRRHWLSFVGGMLVSQTASANQAVRAEPQKASTILQPDQPSHQAFIKRAFDMRDKATARGDQSYGAVVVRNNIIVGQAASHVIINTDPTAHAEIEAIRNAAFRLGSRNLTGCILYSSSRPCPMCEVAAYWAGIDKMIAGREGRNYGSPDLCH